MNQIERLRIVEAGLAGELDCPFAGVDDKELVFVIRWDDGGEEWAFRPEMERYIEAWEDKYQTVQTVERY